jgi:hypothetical protein
MAMPCRWAPLRTLQTGADVLRLVRAQRHELRIWQRDVRLPQEEAVILVGVMRLDLGDESKPTEIILGFPRSYSPSTLTDDRRTS